MALLFLRMQVVNKVINFLAFGISLLSKVLLYLPVQVVSEVEET